MAFHLVNFGGLHQIFNNVTSVIITFALANSKYAHSLKDKMGHHPIGKGISAVLSVPGKAVSGIFKLCGVDTDKSLKLLSKAEQEITKAARQHTANRNAIETLFMCAAGFLALFPVYYLENHREGFLNKVDSWLHPGRTKEEKAAAALKPGDEPKETWWNLINARIIALAVVFGFDQARTNIDTMIKENHGNKATMYRNMDSVFGWGLGNKIYDKLPENTRSWLTKVFSANMKGENITLGGIQDETLLDVLKSTHAPAHIVERGKEIAKLGEEKRLHFKDAARMESLKGKIAAIDKQLISSPEGYKAVERAVFAEQSRLFLTKEVLLTTILSVVIYGATKWPPAHRALSKIGLVKPHHAGHDNALDPTAAPQIHDDQTQAEASTSAPAEPKKSWAKDAPHKEDSKTFSETVKPSQKPEKSGDLFVDQLAAKQEAAAMQPGI